MGKIHRLDEHLSNMIAAGEVVERPAGIVKELIENSIDAKATSIEIQIAQGGIDAITISDNGTGMDQEDAELAFERHATSKLREEGDLWCITTMGFRGEALPSIAAVSQVTLRTNNGTQSSEVAIQYGQNKQVRACAIPLGTSIEIRGLFQKTPARFKHLKRPQYEFSLIADIVQKFALAHPEIAFYLAHDGKEVFRSKGSGHLQEVLMQIYGRDLAKGAIAIDQRDLDYHITGYIAQPHQHRATKYYMTLFVNQRMIRSYQLQKAISDAYSAYMPKDRYPIVVLNIDMDAQLVDVNVHPSKWEIRLAKEKQLEKLVYQTLDQALKDHVEVVHVKERQPREKVEMAELEFTYQRDPNLTKLHQEINEGFRDPSKLPALDFDKIRAKMMEPVPEKKPSERTTKAVEAQVKDVALQYPQHSRPNIPKVEYKENEQPISLAKTPISQPVQDKKNGESSAKAREQTQELPKQSEVKETQTPQAKRPAFPQMEVIGQFHNCYIIAQGEAGLYIIDQHAAAERYHYEVIKQAILSGNTDTQPLLLPITLESDAGLIARLSELNEAMAILGIQFELFGNQTLVVRELPLWMQDTKEQEFLQDLVDGWRKEERVDAERLRHLAIATMACHSSIRFHHSLSMDEMKRVIADLASCEQPFHCPHGRPTFICMSEKQLVKEFLR
ncbi:MAG: DNA mismatch repair endonuclease MutL [Erysipelotrichaceae bacterium]|nr:DNA mismatch repair endonuclease MutL [Erysipelotrichaceae bacterium]